MKCSHGISRLQTRMAVRRLREAEQLDIRPERKPLENAPSNVRKRRASITVQKALAQEHISASELDIAERLLARLVAHAYASDHSVLFGTSGHEVNPEGINGSANCGTIACARHPKLSSARESR